jgi:hypothetical protein
MFDKFKNLGESEIWQKLASKSKKVLNKLIPISHGQNG